MTPRAHDEGVLAGNGRPPASALPRDPGLLGEAAERVSRSLLVFDADARVLACNAAARRTLAAHPWIGLAPLGGPRGAGAMRLLVHGTARHGDIEQAVHECAAAAGAITAGGPVGPGAGEAARAVRTLHLQGGSSSPGLLLHLSGVVSRPSRETHRSGVPAVLGTLIDRTRPLQLDLRRLGELFDLSASSARVAEVYLRVDSVKDAARMLGISANTVKTHLAAVYERTGCSRQSQLVRLLMSLADGAPN